jgi:sugar phosphate isomerase/epimerase
VAQRVKERDGEGARMIGGRMKIGCMLWRIGDILDLYEQIEWVKEHRFQEVSFWTIPGIPGAWQGFGAEQATQDDINKLKSALVGIPEVDLHAGFPLDSTDADSRKATIQRLMPTFELAEAINASVVTIHPDQRTAEFSGATRDAALADSLMQINEVAGKSNVLVGIETEWDMLLIEELDLPHVGITVDTGHMHFRDGEAFKPYGSLGGLIKRFRKKIVHLHVHDYDGKLDHIAVGRGYIDFPDIIKALCEIQFQGSLCLEINPDREPPEAICESRELIKPLEKA